MLVLLGGFVVALVACKVVIIPINRLGSQPEPILLAAVDYPLKAAFNFSLVTTIFMKYLWSYFVDKIILIRIIRGEMRL